MDIQQISTNFNSYPSYYCLEWWKPHHLIYTSFIHHFQIQPPRPGTVERKLFMKEGNTSVCNYLISFQQITAGTFPIHLMSALPCMKLFVVPIDHCNLEDIRQAKYLNLRQGCRARFCLLASILTSCIVLAQKSVRQTAYTVCNCYTTSSTPAHPKPIPPSSVLVAPAV